MNGIVGLALQVLIKIFGQDKLFEAFKEITERRTKIKLVKLDEQTDLREIQNDILEEKARRELSQQKRKTERIETRNSGEKKKKRKRDKSGRYVKNENK